MLKRMKIKYIIMQIMLFVAIVAQAQSVDLTQQFQGELKAKNRDVTSIECRFEQLREVSVLADVARKEGDFYFVPPCKMLLKFDDSDYIKMNDTHFAIKTKESVTTTKIASNPMLRNLNAILAACMVGNFDEMTRGFDVKISRSTSEWVVTLTPQRGKASAKVARIVIHFASGDMSLNSLKMEERSGDATTYLFTDKRFNTAIDNNIFNIAG